MPLLKLESELKNFGWKFEAVLKAETTFILNLHKVESTGVQYDSILIL